MIDGVAYLPDHEIPLLIDTQSRNTLVNSVKTLTLEVVSVKSLTPSIESVDNQDVNNVKILTSEQETIISTPDVKLNGENLDKKYKILNLIEEIRKI